MPEVEDVLKDMAAFLDEIGHRKQFEEWMLNRGHDEDTVKQYNEVISELN